MLDSLGTSAWLASHGMVVLLVLARITGLIVAAPWLSGGAVPMSVRVGLSVAITAMVAPSQTSAHVELNGSIATFVLAVAAETLVGLVLALGMALLLAGLKLAGQIAGQVAGLSWAEIVDPATGAEAPVLAQFLGLLAIVLFLLLGGHRELLDGLLGSFDTLRPGATVLTSETLGALVDMLVRGFELALRAAAPAIAAGWLATAVVAIASRVVSPTASAAFGLSLNTIAAVGAVSLSLGGIAMTVGDEVQPAVELLLRSWATR